MSKNTSLIRQQRKLCVLAEPLHVKSQVTFVAGNMESSTVCTLGNANG